MYVCLDQCLYVNGSLT